MRLTLRIDDDVLEAARELAVRERKTLGETISALVRRGLKSRPSAGTDHGFPVFAVRADTPPITLKTVRRALGDRS